MSLFNDKQREAMRTGVYLCEECGKPMVWETENEDILVCPYCGYSVDSDRYGYTDEEYEALFPTKEELLGYSDDEYDEDEDDSGETYDEVFNELDDD